MPATCKIIILCAVLFFPGLVWAALSSSVITGDCPAGQTTVFKMSSISNAHAGLASSSYPVSVCAGNVAGLSNSCSGTFAAVIKLSGATNAHARQGDQADYPSATNACLSVPAGGSVSVGYQLNDCSGFDTILASMSQFPTNAHVGNEAAYPNKICASASEPPGGVILIPSSNNPPPAAPLPAPEEEIATASPSAEEIREPLPPTPLSIFEEMERGAEEGEVIPVPVLAEGTAEPANEFLSAEGQENLLAGGALQANQKNRGFFAAAAAVLAGINFPPRDFLDWSFWVVALVLALFAGRALLRALKGKPRETPKGSPSDSTAG